MKVGHFKEDADFAGLLDEMLERRDEVLIIGIGQLAGGLHQYPHAMFFIQYVEEARRFAGSALRR